MKISCQSCHSKYNVADEKVQGKIVKIRCRKCGATIVDNGTGGATTNGTTETDGSHGAVGSDATQWHVNVAENDQRTLTMAELVDAYNNGVVTQDTFLWCDGMDDWKPLAEVEAVVSALHASANQLAVGTPGAFEPQAAAGYEQQASQQPGPAYEPPPYEAPAPAAPAYEPQAAYAAPAEPRRAAVAKRDARARDLFATNAGEELHTSAPASPAGMAPVGGGDGALTGQRNENSVLFSLAVLTQNAEAHRPPEQPTSNTEDSGLIDLKALAAKAESMRPPPGMDGDVFHSPLGFTQAPLGAPVGAFASGGTEQPKSKLPLFIGAGAGVLVLLVLGIVIGVKIAGSGPTPVPTMVVTTVTAPTASVDPPASASAAAQASASAAPSASVAATSKKLTGGPGGAWHPPPPGPGIKPGPGGGSSGGGSSGGTSPSPTPAPKKGGDCGCNGDLMCLMKCSTH